MSSYNLASDTQQLTARLRLAKTRLAEPEAEPPRGRTAQEQGEA